MKIVLASNNRGKLAELQSILTPLGVQLIAQGDLFAGKAPEPHCTFVENALAKARFAAEKTGLPAIADDAGLCLDAFGGLPGVQTAYYCTQFGYEKSDANNASLLSYGLMNMVFIIRRWISLKTSRQLKKSSNLVIKRCQWL